MDFIKMHGLGNDFIVLDVIKNPVPDNIPALAEKLCDRHFSVGGDGLVLIAPFEGADAEMRMFNPDGSEAEMCGNAIRCVAKYLYESGHVPKDSMCIHTLAGLMQLKLFTENGNVRKVSVDMGKPRITGKCEILIEGRREEFMMVSTGNPHAVTYGCFPDDEIFFKYGPRIERNPVFAEGTNVEFCRLVSPRRAEVRVWERGAGATLACGTGATAAFFAGVKTGLLEKRAVIALPGGELEFEMADDGHVFMTGPAETAFTGHI